MKPFFFSLLLLPIVGFAEETIAEQTATFVNQEIATNHPAFDTEKAWYYLSSVHSFLQSIGGHNLYAEMKEKSDEERKVIQEKLSALLAPISQNIEAKPGWCGGFGSIGLQGFYLCLDRLLQELAPLQDEKTIAVKIFGFFKYLGCKEEIVLLFPQEDLK